jgi:hypothetical protein
MTRSHFGRQYIQTTNGNLKFSTASVTVLNRLDIHKPPGLALMLGTLHFGTEFILGNEPIFWDDCI